MEGMGKRWRVIFFGLFLCAGLRAEGTRLGRGIYYDGPWWSFVRVGMLGAVQRTVRTNTYFGEFSLNPWLAVTEWFAFRGNFGVSAFKSNVNENFLVTEYQLFFSFSDIFGITFEPGFGAQTWWKNGDSHLLLSANLLFPVDYDGMPWFRYLYIGYSGFFLPNLYTHQAKIGAELTLW